MICPHCGKPIDQLAQDPILMKVQMIVGGEAVPVKGVEPRIPLLDNIAEFFGRRIFGRKK